MVEFQHSWIINSTVDARVLLEEIQHKLSGSTACYSSVHSRFPKVVIPIFLIVPPTAGSPTRKANTFVPQGIVSQCDTASSAYVTWLICGVHSVSFSYRSDIHAGNFTGYLLRAKRASRVRA